MTSGSPPPEWAAFLARHCVGDPVQVTVTKALPFGSLVEVGPGVPGLLTRTGPHAVGDRVPARIDAIDDVEHRVSVVGV